MKFAIAILFHFITSLAFACLGVYCLTKVFNTSGGWLIAAGILSLIGTSVTSSSTSNKTADGESQKKEERLEK